MTTLDVVVFLFGLVISILVVTGFLLVFYRHAFAEQARRERSQLNTEESAIANSMDTKTA